MQRDIILLELNLQQLVGDSQSSGAVWTGRWARALIPYPILPSPVPNKPYGFCGRKAQWKKEVDIKHHGRRKSDRRQRGGVAD